MHNQLGHNAKHKHQDQDRGQRHALAMVQIGKIQRSARAPAR